MRSPNKKTSLRLLIVLRGNHLMTLIEDILNLSKKLIELMGSKLQVSSQSGQGSTFWFDVTLPIVDLEMDRDELEEETRIVGYQGKQRHILIVDDQEKNRLMLQNMLEPLGFKITLGENGQEAIELAQKIRPDCILTDLVMPVKTGLEVVKEVRRIPDIQDVMIIAISANVLDLDRVKSQLMGCDSFLPKPVNEQKLLDLLQRYLQLDWIYEDLENSNAFDNDELLKTETIVAKPLIVPPPGEMVILYELAMLGSMKKIRERAIYLQQLDEKYAPLASKLQELAQDFQEKAIVKLIKQYL